MFSRPLSSLQPENTKGNLQGLTCQDALQNGFQPHFMIE